MANGSIAQQLISGVQQQTRAQAGDVGQAIQVFQQAQQMKQNRVVLEQQKAAIQQKKISKFTNALISGAQLKDKATRNAFMKNFLPKLRDGLELQNIFTDDALQFAGASDENAGRVLTIRTQLLSGELTGPEAIALFNDPEQFIEITPTLAEDVISDVTVAERQKTGRQRLEAQVTERERAAGRFETTVERQKTRQRQQDVQKLSLQFGKNGIPESLNTLKRLDKLIIGGLDDPKGDIAGRGKTGNFPDFFLSPRGKELRQVTAELRNSILKMRSGGAVTPSEAARLLEELGLSGGFIPTLKTDKQFITGLKRVRDKIRDKLATIEAGFDPETNKTFQDRFNLRTGQSLSSTDPFFGVKKGKGKARLTLDVFDKLSTDRQRDIAQKLNLPLEQVRKKLGAK